MGRYADTLDYIGKAQIDGKGTWKQEGDTITVDLYEQDGKAVKQTSTYTVKDGNLVGTNPPNEVFTKTAADVVFYSGLYTTERANASGTATLKALTLLPNGQASLYIASPAGDVNETGTWTVGKNTDTGTDAVTVKSDGPGG